MRTHAPRDAADVLDIVAQACASGERLEIVGGGRCRGYGRPMGVDAALDLSALSGVVLYEPEELVLSARPATPLAEIEALLLEHHQHLAFEPPDLGPLWGRAAGGGTIGGCLLLGLGGPRRMAAGGPRDHFLGLKGINGHGQVFAAGGRVVKNVTGFDLPKLFAGSLGTLGVLTEVTIKVMPRPQTALTLAVPGLSASDGVALLGQAARSPAQITGGAHLPPAIAAASAVPALRSTGRSSTLLRLEGFAPSVEWSASLLAELVRGIASEPLLRVEQKETQILWREIGSVSYFADGTASPVWRVSIEPARAAEYVAAIEARAGASCFFDGCGGVVWVRVPGNAMADAPESGTTDALADAGAAIVRGGLVDAGSGTSGIGAVGYATLVRAAASVRDRVPPFQPLEPGLASLTHRVKQQFDPRGVFNPGRMYAEG